MPGVEAALGEVGATWFYTWSPTPADQAITPPAGVTFVPMIWGEADAAPERLALASGEMLLGFNEPDVADQSSLTVERALELWPRLEATGLPLCSPATGGDPSAAESWLRRFLAGAAERGYRVDALCVHFYAADFDPDAAVVSLRRFLERVHEMSPLPVWLTEYGIVRYGATPEFPAVEDQAAFARASAALLGSLPSVERYAWFALPPWRDGDTVHLHDPGEGLTAVGAAYRDAGPRDLPSAERTVAPGEELLRDPGFESGRPVATWNRVALAEAPGRGLVARIADAQAATWGWVEKSAARLPAGRYRARAWARADGEVAWASLELHDLAGAALASTGLAVDGTWRAFELDAEVEGGAARVVVQAGTAAAGGAIEIDDLSLALLP